MSRKRLLIISLLLLLLTGRTSGMSAQEPGAAEYKNHETVLGIIPSDAVESLPGIPSAAGKSCGATRDAAEQLQFQ